MSAHQHQFNVCASVVSTERPLDDGRHQLVLEHELLHSLRHEQEDQQHREVLHPGPLHVLPESGAAEVQKIGQFDN